MITVTCIECGKKFEAQRTSAKFCSANCRVKWNNKNIATETLVLEETKELNGHEEKKTEIEGMAIPKKTFPTNAEKLSIAFFISSCWLHNNSTSAISSAVASPST